MKYKHTYAKQVYADAKKKLTAWHDEYQKNIREAFTNEATEEEIETIEENWKATCDSVLGLNIFVRNVVENLTENEQHAIAIGIGYWDDKVFADTLDPR